MLERLPLHTKIAAIPALCAVVLLIVGFAFGTILTLQNTVLDQVTGSIVNRGQAAIDGLAGLSKRHVAIVDLLTHATTGQFDEEQIYVAGENLLSDLAEIEAVIDELAELFSQSDREVLLVGQIERHLTSYKVAAASAIEMSTVDTALAGKELLNANGSYEKLNQIFLQLVDLTKSEMRMSLRDLSARSHDIQIRIMVLTAIGIGAAVLISLVIYLSISRGLRALSNAMLTLADGITEISIPKITSKDELGAMVEALIVFRSNAQDLKVALEKERELNGLQRQFVSMVSHEFRTPLAIIDGSAQRLLRRADSMTIERLSKGMNKIRISVRRLTELMESVLSAARLEEGRIKFAPNKCELNAVVTKVSANHAELNPGRQFIFDLDDKLGAIEADEKLVRQIVSNLISNAIKYSPASSRIWVDTVPLSNGAVQLSVRDEGVGIPESEQKMLFERFFRASSSTGIPGSGIGLHLAQFLAGMHGGTIDFESVENKGTTFRLKLPLVPNRESENALIGENPNEMVPVPQISPTKQQSVANPC